MNPEIRIINPKQGEAFNTPAMRWVKRLSKLLDSQFIIPGTNVKFGLDPIVSLFPVLGDLVTYFISGALIYTMYNHGASRKVVIKMIINSTIDAVIGAIPLIGSIFDIFYRSNDRNLRLLQEHYFEGKHHGSGNGILIVVAILALLIVGAAIFGLWKLVELIF